MLAPIDSSKLGRCPSCHAQGVIGYPCAERVCTMRGYCFVPHDPAREDADHVEDDPLIGQRCGEFLLVRLIGTGGFGRVYRALQLPIGRPAAVKILPLEGAHAGTAGLRLSRFEAEIKALARLSHPNIVRLFHYGLHRGVPYLAMELVEGARTVRAEIDLRAAARRGFSLDEVESILVQLLAALECAHAQDVVHRDVKPDNIMLEAVSGHGTFVRVLDFGQAKFLGDHTATSMLLGTPAYMATEQLTHGPIGPWTDLYAVGALAFELLSGRHPYGTGDVQAILAKKLDHAFDPAAALTARGYPEALCAFVRRALSADLSERYQNAQAMADDLRLAIAALRAAGDRFATVELVALEAAAPSDASRRISEPHPIGPTRRLGPSPRRSRAPPTPAADALSQVIAHARGLERAPVRRARGRALAWLGVTTATALFVVLLTILSGAAHAPSPSWRIDIAEQAHSEPRLDPTAVLAPTLAGEACDALMLCALAEPDQTAGICALPADAPPADVAAIATPDPQRRARAPRVHPARTMALEPTSPEPAPELEPPQELHRALLLTEPPGAEVLIDGRAIGTSPITVQWRPGLSSQVSVVLAGYERAGFELGDGQAAKLLRLELVQSPSRIGAGH